MVSHYVDIFSSKTESLFVSKIVFTSRASQIVSEASKNNYRGTYESRKFIRPRDIEPASILKVAQETSSARINDKLSISQFTMDKRKLPMIIKRIRCIHEIFYIEKIITNYLKYD